MDVEKMWHSPACPNTKIEGRIIMGYCLCHPWKRGDPFVLHDPFLREDICIHCGGIIRYEEDEMDKGSSNSYISKREYFSRQAKSCSIRQDHSTAIEFYKEALKHSFQNREKCEMLCFLCFAYIKWFFRVWVRIHINIVFKCFFCFV